MKIEIKIPYFLSKLLSPHIEKSWFYRDSASERNHASERNDSSRREDILEKDDTLENKVGLDDGSTSMEGYMEEYRKEMLNGCKKTNQQILKWKSTFQFLSGMVETEKVIELAGLLSEDYFWCKMTFFWDEFFGKKPHLNIYYRNPSFNSLQLAHSCIHEKGMHHFYSDEHRISLYIPNEMIYCIEKEIRDAYEI